MFLAFISTTGIHIDVMVLTECWTNDKFTPPTVQGYSYYATKNSFNQNDGIVVYIRESLTTAHYEPPEIVQANCLVITLPDNLCIVCCYRSPSFSNVAPFLSSIDTLLRSITCRTLIFTGDINIDILPGNDKESVNDYLNVMAMHGLVQGVNIPTRNKTCLDHFMVRCPMAWQTVVFSELTDHAPILLYIDNTNIKKETIRKHKTIVDLATIEELLKSETWLKYYEITDVELAAQYLIYKLNNLINENTIIKTIPTKYQPLKPWITVAVVKSIRRRNALHKKFKQNSLNNQIKNEYIAYRNTLNKIIKNLKDKYYQEQLLKNKGNPKEIWNLVKDVGNLNVVRRPASELLKIDQNPKSSLDNVNAYFTSIGQKLANETLSRINMTNIELAKNAKEENTPINSFCAVPTDPMEIKEIIQGLKQVSSPGWDNIPTRIVKHFIRYLTLPIAYLCDLSLESGNFPAVFKKAIVCPIFKAGARDQITNYRPISILSTLSKILEKVMNKRLVSFLEKYNVLVDNQFGFREKRSTEDAVLRLTSWITSHTDKGDKCIGVFLDLQKAFDTVSIPILLSRLENVGIRGVTLKWFETYLTGRSQSVRVENCTSEYYACTYGVPQGSTLGPTLFLIYINSLGKINFDNGTMCMFADDTVLMFHNTSWKTVTESAEMGLKKVTCWLENSILSLNVDKTKYLCFSKTAVGRPCSDHKLKIHVYPCNRGDKVNCSCLGLNKVNSIRYLGVIIDDKLNWLEHIKVIQQRVRKLIYVFKNLRSVASQELLKQIYQALCESVIRYCIPAWGGAAKTHLIMAERAQRAVLKVAMYLTYRHPTSDVYKKYQVLSVRKLYIYECIRRYHRSITPQLLNVARRDRCHIPTVKSQFARRQYDYMASRLYNKLSSIKKIKNCSKNELMKIITTWLKDLDYDTVEDLMVDYSKI